MDGAVSRRDDRRMTGSVSCRRAAIMMLCATFALLSGGQVVPVASAQQANSTCQRDGGWATVNAELVSPVVTLTNDHRKSVGLAPLVPSRTLTNAALWKAAHMAHYDYFDHADPAPPVERGLGERVTACGYEGGAGENIGKGYTSPSHAMGGWLDSPGHRDNIEDAGYVVMGAGVATADDGTIYWVQIFGTTNDTADDVHTAPQVTADVVSVAEDTPATIDVLANDTDPDGDPLGIASASATTGGALETTPVNTITFTPPANLNGDYHVTYTAVDPFGLTATGQLTVDVLPVNDAPRARRDTATVRAGRRMSVSLLRNDTDADSDDLSVRMVARPRHGKLVAVDRDGGVLRYRANRGAGGKADRMTYRVTDGAGGSDEARLTVTITRR